MFVNPVDKWSGISGLTSALLPPTCVLCGAPGLMIGGGRDLCGGCAAELPHNRDSCFQCAVPFASPMPVGTRCAACQRQLAAVRYQPRGLSLRGGDPDAHRTVRSFEGGSTWCDCSASVSPIGFARLDPPRPRGAAAGTAACVPAAHPRLQSGAGDRSRCRPGAGTADRSCRCVRIAPTPPQAGLDERARHRNIRGAFSVRGPVPWVHVAILDDVVTTGSTVAELSRVLRKAGVRRIQVWAVARTP